MEMLLFSADAGAFGVRTCFLVGAAPQAPRIEARPGDYIIAADGGCDHLRRWGILPDFVVGDMDSLRGAPPPEAPCRRVPGEKSETDMALAFREGYVRGYRRFEMVGAAGGRPDHTMANLQLLVRAARRGAFVLMRDGSFCAAALTKGCELRLRGAGIVSVFACCGEARGVRIRGMKYALENSVLRGDNPRGVSNELEGGEGLVSLERGALLVYWEERGIVGECRPRQDCNVKGGDKA
jgi:thiamine pyrophosphokinase